MVEFEYRGRHIVVISDTHGAHRGLALPSCHILIHVGDACTAGNQVELDDFFEWFASQSAEHKIFVSGNHDLPFELFPEFAATIVPSGVMLLNNHVVEIDGIIIAGLMATPGLLFDVEFDTPVDIILSHGAPRGQLDDCGNGCVALAELIERAKPAIAIFGHFHKYGGREVKSGGIRYINASIYENLHSK